MVNPELGASRVVLVDDHDHFRATLAVILREQGMEVVGEAGSGAAARQLVQTLHPDVVVTDAELPDVDALELTREIVASEALIRVIVLGPASREADAGEVERAFEAGAGAYVYKSAAPDALMSAVRASTKEPFVGYPVGDELSEPEREYTRRLSEEAELEFRQANRVGRPKVDWQRILHDLLAWLRKHILRRP
jgi:DNA-binding NarL/FixJ family response regulator